jgi:Xaa-Pro aminopeptidase
MLTLEGCRSRLARFREELDEQGVDLAVLSNYRNVYYLSGHLREVELPQFLVVEPKGKVVLITDTQPVQSAAEEVINYEAYSVDWPISFRGISQKAAQALKSVLKSATTTGRRIGLEPDRLSALFAEVIAGYRPAAEQVDIGPLLYRLRKPKDPDEISLIAECVKAIEGGYSVARQAIRPGASELDVFKEMHGEIVHHAGYNLKFEADFACGVRAIKEGGTPLRREILPGDLYIIDVYPSFHGYHGDLCRTFAASSPTELQRRAWEVVRNALQLTEEVIRPGVRARDVWKRLRDYIDSFEFVRGSFWHHAGHGLGLDPQEAPWIIPGSDHIFEVGDVIAVEPGCYSEALQGGVRLERDYVVRVDGLENLSQFPLQL